MGKEIPSPMKRILILLIAMTILYSGYSLFFKSLKMADWSHYGHDSFWIVSILTAMVIIGDKSSKTSKP